MNDTLQRKPTVVLVHGAWADGSSWQHVIPFLLAEGIPVVAVQNPTSALADDVAATERAMDRIEGPIVLVGHSWGGAVITQAGVDPKVKSLVYVAAFAPNADETVGDLVGRHAPPPALSHIIDDGTGWLTLDVDGWIHDVAQDLPEMTARTLAVLQPPLAARTFADKVTEAAWATRPASFIVSANDRIVSVALQREMASAMQAKTTELDAGHLSLLSQPRQVAHVILEAVAALSTA